MTAVLNEPPPRQQHSAGQRLREETAAIRLSFTWFGTRKTLTPEQKAQAADAFGAEGAFLSAGKKLVDTGHPAFKAVTGVRGRIIAFWKANSLPYPEPGLRLIRQDDINLVNRQLQRLKAELEESVEQLDRRYEALRSAARQRLGSLYNASDYPPSLRGLFDCSWDFPSVEPPDYLAGLNAELYEAECQRVTAQFDQAVQLAEQVFAQELTELVSHLSERLTGAVDGKPKVFRDSAVENLDGFFDRFRRLTISSNEQLEQVIQQARSIMRGVQPQKLRENASLRERIAGQLVGVQTALDGLMVDRPRRNILRPQRAETT